MSVLEVVKACGFSEEVASSYVSKLAEDGYETISDLKDMSLEEIVECGLKKGHAKRLVKELKGASSAAGATGGVEAVAGSGAAAVRALKPAGDAVEFENGAKQEKLEDGTTVQTDADGTKIFVFPVSPGKLSGHS